MLNLVNEQGNIDKINLYTKDLDEGKWEQILIKKRGNTGIKHFNIPNEFIECSNSMDDVYENINDYNATRKKIIFFVLMA